MALSTLEIHDDFLPLRPHSSRALTSRLLILVCFSVFERVVVGLLLLLVVCCVVKTQLATRVLFFQVISLQVEEMFAFAWPPVLEICCKTHATMHTYLQILICVSADYFKTKAK